MRDKPWEKMSCAKIRENINSRYSDELLLRVIDEMPMESGVRIYREQGRDRNGCDFANSKRRWAAE